MRAFIGIKLNDCQKEILKIQETLKDKDKYANYTRVENLHLTLCFLGDILDKEVESIKAVLDNIRLPSFDISTNKLKIMKDMVILEIEENEELIELHKYLISELEDQGFLLRKRKYYPHITLCRKTSLFVDEELSLRSTVKDIILFSSERINNILRYTPVYIKKLKAK